MRLFAKIFAGRLATEPLPAGSDRSAAAHDGGTRRCGRLARQLGALWAAAAAMVALIDALNVAHGAVEARSWWARRLVALILTVGLALFVLTALVSVISGERVGPEVAGALGLGRAFTLAWGLLR